MAQIGNPSWTPMERGERGFGEENFLATIARHDDEHNTLPRIGTARPRSRRDLGGNRGADPGRECVGRAWSRWPWNALTFTVSAVPDEDRGEHADREKERGETSERAHAHTPRSRPRVQHTPRRRDGDRALSTWMMASLGILSFLERYSFLEKVAAGEARSSDNGFDEKSIILFFFFKYSASKFVSV